MEVFEVHITGDKSIHKVAKSFDHKTITIDLLNPDKSVLREEHMTSIIYKYSFPVSYELCKRLVLQIANVYAKMGVNIVRVKIESAPYDHYMDQSLYMESHFISDEFHLPTSRNQRKSTFLATDRTYEKSKYKEFSERYKGTELELCLYDSFVEEDTDWFDAYENKNMLTIDMAYRLRFERALTLPVNCDFETPRLANIARRQHTLFKELDKLDQELKDMNLEQLLHTEVES